MINTPDNCFSPVTSQMLILRFCRNILAKNTKRSLEGSLEGGLRLKQEGTDLAHYCTGVLDFLLYVPVYLGLRLPKNKTCHNQLIFLLLVFFIQNIGFAQFYHFMNNGSKGAA